MTDTKKPLDEAVKVDPEYPVHSVYRRALDAWTVGTPEHTRAEGRLKQMAIDNPQLFHKLTTWD